MSCKGKCMWNFWKALELDGSAEKKFIFALQSSPLPISATMHIEDDGIERQASDSLRFPGSIIPGMHSLAPDLFQMR